VPACATLSCTTVAGKILDTSPPSARLFRRVEGAVAIWVSACWLASGSSYRGGEATRRWIGHRRVGGRDAGRSRTRRRLPHARLPRGTGGISSPGAAACAPSASAKNCLRGGDRVAAGAPRALPFRGENGAMLDEGARPLGGVPGREASRDAVSFGECYLQQSLPEAQDRDDSDVATRTAVLARSDVGISLPPNLGWVWRRRRTGMMAGGGEVDRGFQPVSASRKGQTVTFLELDGPKPSPGIMLAGARTEPRCWGCLDRVYDLVAKAGKQWAY
jgi:hypothetical protein